MKKLTLLAVFGMLAGFASAQQNAEASYNQHAAFAPYFYTQNGNNYRSSDGAPGPNYWQNAADYNINVKLDTTQKHIDGSVQIDYTNNSPDNMPYVWLYVDQNIYREDSRAVATTVVSGGRYAATKFTQGDELKSVSVKMNGKTFHPKYVVSDTRLQILLPEALKAKGGKLQINISYGFTIPEKGSDRMGRLHTKNGWIYEIAQWYPRMCVYDDVEGWNTLPYLGAGEFYLEYGNINYSITAPANLVIVGSGVLQNPAEVLTSSQRKKLAEAAQSDATVNIHSLADVQEGKDFINKKELTWKFQCNNTRDVAWAASKAFIWDAVRIKMQSGKVILGQSVYPEETAMPSGWDSSAYYTKKSIELNSYWHDFPYPVATNVAGIVGGMEYPGIVFCSSTAKAGADLWFVTLHEFGHNWFPMLVGSNERKYAWMDEGFNTFTNYICSRILYNGAYNNEPNEYKIAKRFFKNGAEIPMTIPDVILPYNLADEGYYKPAVGLLILRDVVLGHKRFDYAFKQYINNWAYKHPTPDDFFRTMENAAGEDLGWFWRGWFFHNWTIDQAVKAVKYEDNDPAKGALVSIENIGQMPLPVKLKIEEENGKITNMLLPVEIWQRGAEWTFHVNTTSKIKKIILDPEKQYPDVDPENNVWPGENEMKPIPAGVSAKSVIDHYLQEVGGKENLERIRDMSAIYEGDIQGQNIRMKQYHKMPDKFLETIELPAMHINIVKILVNGDIDSIIQRGVAVALNDKAKDGLKSLVQIFPELQLFDNGNNVALMGIESVKGQDAYVIKITNSIGEVVTNYYAIKSGLKIASQSKNGILNFADYQTVNDIKAPMRVTMNSNGYEIPLKAKEIKVNSDLSDDIFK
ncbi:M1 family aminopeptidase [Arachidicoccus sp.]|uniref:M1 family aminopeptidase n=1 Tax=Arachidicoccus sp. TaxID=1872624 RepID=UPI003D21BA73